MGEEDSQFLDAVFKAVTGGLPESYQRHILRTRSKRVIINKSRRVGVSTTIGVKALLFALNGKTALIAAPGQEQSREVMARYVEPVLRAIPAHLQPRLLENTKTLKRFEGGGEIVSLPNNASTVRGRSPHLIVMDEAAQFLDGTDREMYEALEPMLLLGEQMILVSTPFGDRNLFAEIWRSAETRGFERIQIHYSHSPRLDNLIPELRKGYDDISWAQEFENEFHGEVASEFPMALLERCVDQELRYEPGATGEIAGADIGRRIDMTSVCTLRQRPGEPGTWNLVEKQSWRGVPLPEQEERFVAIAGRVGRFIFDRGGMGEQMGDSLPSRCSNVYPFGITAENKSELWLNLKRMLEQRRVRFQFDPVLMNGLNSVHRYFRMGRVIIDAERTDETGHADEATALAIACWLTRDDLYPPDIPAGVEPGPLAPDAHRRNPYPGKW